MYIYIYIYILFIYEQETSVCMCCVVKINKKHNVCLTNFRILLIFSHVCDVCNTDGMRTLFIAILFTILCFC